MTRRPRRPVTFFMLGVLCLGFAITSTVSDWPEISLLLFGPTTTATVVAFQEVQGRQHSLQVRYHFRLGPTGPVYSHFGLALGSDAYAPLNEQAWQQALTSKAVLIRYDRHDPWHNHPVASPTQTEHLWFWVAAESALLVAALVLFGWFGVRIRKG